MVKNGHVFGGGVNHSVTGDHQDDMTSFVLSSEISELIKTFIFAKKHPGWEGRKKEPHLFVFGKEIGK